jgi:hypothetical protein
MRGVLTHALRLEGGLVADYRVRAPCLPCTLEVDNA